MSALEIMLGVTLMVTSIKTYRALNQAHRRTQLRSRDTSIMGTYSLDGIFLEVVYGENISYVIEGGMDDMGKCPGKLVWVLILFMM